MSVGVRRALTAATAVVSCSAFAVLAASPAQAHGQGSGWCGFGTLSYMPNGEPPVVTTPNATALAGGTLTDEAGYGLTDVHAVLTVVPQVGTATPGGAGTPLVAWRIDGGAWQPVTLTWNGLSGPGAAWHSSDIDLGLDLGPAASSTVDLETEFASNSPGGEYVDQLSFTAQTCGAQQLGAGLNFTDYNPAAPSAPVKPAAAKTSPAAVADPPPNVERSSARADESAAPSATPSAPRSARPSPSASQLDITFVQVLPSAEPAASTQTGGALPDGVLAVVAVVFLGGLVCIRAVRRRKSS
jgi:hypothetical protein